MFPCFHTGEAQIELIGPTKIEVEDVPIALRLLMADALAARGRSAESLRLGTVREAAPQPIIGGTDAEKYKYPWHVQVYWVLYSGGAYMCGGTIIDSRTVLTAGHCATDVGQR